MVTLDQRHTQQPANNAQERQWPFDVSRGLAASGVMLSAVVHFDLWSVGGFREVSWIGPLFLLNALGGLVLGVLLLCWRHWLPALAAAGYGALTLGAFVLSVTVGLFGIEEVASGAPQLIAGIAEGGCVVFGLIAAWLSWRAGRDSATTAARAR